MEISKMYYNVLTKRDLRPATDSRSVLGPQVVSCV